ncbi:MAG: toxin-antitoxin system YwqK family antitoxin [Bacteroidia bacterium]
MEQLTKEEKFLAYSHFGLAIGGGLLAGMLGAAAWAALTVITQVQFGYAAIGVGYLVGIGVRFAGAGILPRFQVLAAVLGVLSCILGNMFSELGFYSVELQMSFLDALAMYSFAELLEYSFSSFGIFDLLFFSLAAGAAYRYSLRELSLLEESQHNNEHFDPRPPLAGLRAPLAFGGYSLSLMLSAVLLIGHTAERRYHYESGPLQSKGLYKKGLREGVWQYFNEEGQLNQRGQFQNDIAHGFWEWYFPNGQLSAKQSFFYGNEHGFYTGYYESGALLDSGSFYYGRKMGLWHTYYENGQLQSYGNFHGNQKHGLWTYYHDNGQLEARAYYRDDELNGPFESYHPNGKAALLLRLDGERIYLGWVADSNGRVLVSEGAGQYEDVQSDWCSLGMGKVLDSLPVGFWKKQEDGYLKVTYVYKNDEKKVYEIWDERQKPGNQLVKNGSGPLETYYESGNLYVKGTYKNGLRTGEWLIYYDQPHQLSVRTNYLKGLREGISESYSESGQAEAIITYAGGKQHGLSSWFHSSGELSAEVQFENDLKQANQLIYDDWGRLICTETYEAGQLRQIYLNRAPKKLAYPPLP